MKLSNLKRVLSLIVTVTLIAGLTVVPAFAEDVDVCAGYDVVEAPIAAPSSHASGTSSEATGEAQVYGNGSGTQPRFTVAFKEPYAVGQTIEETPLAFAKAEFSITYSTNQFALVRLNGQTGTFQQSWPSVAAGQKKDYMFIANLQDGTSAVYEKGNATPVVSFPAVESFSYLMIITNGGSYAADQLLATVSDLSATVYYGEWSLNGILGAKTVTYPTPGTRSGSDMTLSGSNGTWTAVFNGTNQGGLSLPLMGTSVDMSAAYIKTEATIDANGAKDLFAIPELTINGGRYGAFSPATGVDPLFPPMADVSTGYTSYIDLVSIIDVANQDLYLYTAGMEPVVFSFDEHDLSISALTGLNLAWRKTIAGTTGTINISNYKQTTYYDKALAIADVLADGGVADTKEIKASLYAFDNTAEGEYANVNIAKDSDVWTVTTTGENSEVKMLSALYAPKMGYVATENARNYADFVHYSATVKVTGGEYESYKLGAAGVSAAGNQTTIAPAVYGTNGLPKLLANTEYDVDMIYEVATGHTYVYVNGVLCEDRGLSISGLDFTGVSMAFTGVTSPVTAVVTNPTFKYYNKSANANLASVKGELNDDAIVLNYEGIVDGTATAQFYGNLADESYVIAVYNGNALKTASMEEFDGVAREISQADIAAGDTVKVFVWDTATLAPVLSATTID